MKYPLIIIGGGTAGTKLAFMACKKVKTLLIEPGVMGGTCLNTGCIPTKAMIYASLLYAHTKSMPYFGIDAKAKVNFDKLMTRVNSISKEGRDHIYVSIDRNKNLTVINAKAEFVGIKKVKAGEAVYDAETIVIATGAINSVPPVKGLKETGYLDNETLLKSKKLPNSVIMIGGGYISMEYASFFNNLGVKVTVIERLPEVLGMLDEDVRQVLLDSHEKNGIKIITNANIIEVKKGVSLKYNDVRDEKSKVKTLSADALFLATGRVPNTKGLGCEKSKIEIGRRGEIVVDDLLKTSCKDIYAIGDCNGKPMFAHSAKRQTDIVMNNLFSENKQKMDFDLIPWATFSEPVVSGIGLSEKEAKEKGIGYGMMKAEFIRNGRAKIIEEQEGFAKVLFDKSSRKILGCCIIGANADDIVHEVVALMYAGGKVDILSEMIHIHPTLSEVMENLR
ncbi:MAG: dihydrolipoyl dehydrogenase [archaeon]